MYTKTHVGVNYIQLCNSHRNADDDIFNNTSNYSQDKDYGKTDRGQYLFSTMGSGLTAMFSNNIIVPIRKKESLKQSQLPKIGKEEGVYIIDYYTIHNDGSINMHSLFDYYIHTHNLEYDEEVVKAIQNKIKVGVHNRNMEITIRLITFIPSSEINDYLHVYVDKTDILIINGMVYGNTIHPHSLRHKESSSRRVRTRNAIEIEVIDNHSNDVRYFQVGNVITTLVPTKDENRLEGIRFKWYKNTVLVSSRRSSLSDAAEEFGIYNDLSSAEACGNPEVTLQLQKVALERAKIGIEEKKINHEAMKINKDAEMCKIKHKHEVKILEQKSNIGNLDVRKKELELTNIRKKTRYESIVNTSKFRMEIAGILAKHNADIHRGGIDYISKVIPKLIL